MDSTIDRFNPNSQDKMPQAPAPQPVPPPFRTWDEYRAAMGKDKDRRVSHEEKMAGAPQAHAKFWKEVIVNAAEIDTAVEQEELEEEQRKVWTREAAARAIAEAMDVRTCHYVADGICRKGCEEVCKFLQFDPPPAVDYERTADDVRQAEREQGIVLPERDTRSSIIDEAKSIINGARNQSYDAPEQNFKRIARHWNAFFLNRFDLDIPIQGADVSLLMDLVKTARLEFNITHKDSWVDKVGYSACGAECALNPGE